MKTNFTKRPFDTSVSFTVHSLLVVDALQTFGPDFELLVASHKNLWFVLLTEKKAFLKDIFCGDPVKILCGLVPKHLLQKD